MGRAIYDGAKEVRLFGEEIAVKAEVRYLPGISGHADKQGLIDWLSGFEKKPSMVFVNHGEDAVCESFARCLRDEYGYRTAAPYSGTAYDLATGQAVKVTDGIRIQKKRAGGESRAAAVFARLMAAAQRLVSVARSSEGMANKDLAKLTDQINNLCDKWSR